MEWLPNLILFLLDCFKKLQIKTRVFLFGFPRQNLVEKISI